MSAVFAWFKKIPGMETQPTKDGDVGYDLYADIYNADRTWFDRLISRFTGKPTLVIWPIVGQRTIPSGVHLSMPDDIWCEIRPRSSTSRRKLDVLGGTIDSGYHGEMYTVLHNFGLLPRIIREGERYAQVVFNVALRPTIYTTGFRDFQARAEQSDRGEQGFGSTGR